MLETKKHLQSAKKSLFHSSFNEQFSISVALSKFNDHTVICVKFMANRS